MTFTGHFSGAHPYKDTTTRDADIRNILKAKAKGYRSSASGNRLNCLFLHKSRTSTNLEAKSRQTILYYRGVLPIKTSRPPRSPQNVEISWTPDVA